MFLIAFHFGCRHQAVCLLILHHIDIIALTFLHPLFLFTERTEQVFHQSPVKESSILIGPCALQPCEVSHLGKRLEGGGNQFLVLVEVDEHFYVVTHSCTFRDIAGRQEYLTFVTSIEVHAEINALYDAQGVVVSELNFHHSSSLSSVSSSSRFSS